MRTELDCGRTYRQSRSGGATELGPAPQHWEDCQESLKSRGTAQREYELKSKRTFGFHVLLLNRMQSVPDCKPARDDQPNENADQKKPAIRGERDQQDRYTVTAIMRPADPLRLNPDRLPDSGSMILF